MKIIAILNQKGGVGKTTTAINVAAYLAREGKKVLVIDSDPQGNATSGLGVEKSVAGLYEMLSGKMTTDRIITETSVSHVALIPASQSLAALETEIAKLPDREFLLVNNISNLDYDFILIDCPPALGLLTVNALTSADYLIIPVQAEYYALEGLGQLMDIFQRIKLGLNTKLQLLGLIITMYDKRNSLAEQVQKELNKHFGDSVFKSIIPRNVRLAEAPSYGRSIADHDKWSKGARAYKQLTKEILARTGGKK